MSSRLSERNKIAVETVSVSSAAGATSNGYSMDDCKRITFIVGMGTAAASTATAPTLTVVQSADKTFATSAAVTGATGVLGPSTANQVQSAKQALITMTTAATLAETITISDGVTSIIFTYSTTPNSTDATTYAFGSTLGSTNAGGLEGTMNSLSSVINAATALTGIVASTVGTNAIRLVYDDTATATTGITILTTGVNFAPSYEKSQSIIEVLADDLNATSQYVGIQVSSATTLAQISIVAIKDGLRYGAAKNVARTNVKTT